METLVRNKNKNKTKIDWDLNVWCPEQWYGADSFQDEELWMINARIYGDSIIDTDYTITLLPKEAEAIGLINWQGFIRKHRGTENDWIDESLDGMISMKLFMKLYRKRLSNRVLEFLETLPVYMEDLDPRKVY